MKKQYITVELLDLVSKALFTYNRQILSQLIKSLEILRKNYMLITERASVHDLYASWKLAIELRKQHIEREQSSRISSKATLCISSETCFAYHVANGYIVSSMRRFFFA